MRDLIGLSGLVQPSLQLFNFRLCKPLSQICSFWRWQCFSYSFNAKQAFDDTHRKLYRFRISLPGIFEAAVDMRPTIGCRSAIGNDLVSYIGAVRLQDSVEAI